MGKLDQPRKITVLLADDHVIVRTAVKSIIESVPYLQVLGEASTGEEALKRVRALKPDVILMDVRMPGMGGLESTIRLRQTAPKSKILVLTACESVGSVQRFLRASASGYLTKGVGREELVQAIVTVHRGKRYLTDKMAYRLAMELSSDKASCPFMLLTNREWQLCLMLATGKSVRLISEVLHLTSKTINSYRYRIFEKLNVKNDVELTRLAQSTGLLDDI